MWKDLVFLKAVIILSFFVMIVRYTILNSFGLKATAFKIQNSKAKTFKSKVKSWNNKKAGLAKFCVIIVTTQEL